jgi:hypothetical protein
MDPAHDDTDAPGPARTEDELPADEIIGMGYFPDELGIAGSVGSTLGGILLAAD